MCEEVVLLPIPDFIDAPSFDATHGEYGIDSEGRRCFAIDRCVVPAVQAVWAAGIKTLGCCCGHGSGIGVVSIATEQDGRIDGNYPEPLFALHEAAARKP